MRQKQRFLCVAIALFLTIGWVHQTRIQPFWFRAASDTSIFLDFPCPGVSIDSTEKCRVSCEPYNKAQAICGSLAACDNFIIELGKKECTAILKTEFHRNDNAQQGKLRSQHEACQLGATPLRQVYLHSMSEYDPLRTITTQIAQYAGVPVVQQLGSDTLAVVADGRSMRSTASTRVITYLQDPAPRILSAFRARKKENQSLLSFLLENPAEGQVLVCGPSTGPHANSMLLSLCATDINVALSQAKNRLAEEFALVGIETEMPSFGHALAHCFGLPLGFTRGLGPQNITVSDTDRRQLESLSLPDFELFSFASSLWWHRWRRLAIPNSTPTARTPTSAQDQPVPVISNSNATTNTNVADVTNKIQVIRPNITSVVRQRLLPIISRSPPVANPRLPPPRLPTARPIFPSLHSTQPGQTVLYTPVRKKMPNALSWTKPGHAAGVGFLQELPCPWADEDDPSDLVCQIRCDDALCTRARQLCSSLPLCVGYIVPPLPIRIRPGQRVVERFASLKADLPWNSSVSMRAKLTASDPMCRMGNSTMALVHIHIPKTGGTTFNEIFLQSVAEFLNLHLTTNIPVANIIRTAPDIIGGHNRIGIGDVLQNDNVRYVTHLREPVGRVVSLYHYIRRTSQHTLYPALQNLTLREFVLDPRFFLEARNTAVTFLACGPKFGPNSNATWIEECENNATIALAAAKRNLESFAVVGTLDDLADFGAVLVHCLGVPLELARRLEMRINDKKSKTSLSDEDRDLIMEYNREELELYEFAHGLWAARWAEFAPILEPQRDRWTGLTVLPPDTRTNPH